MNECIVKKCCHTRLAPKQGHNGTKDEFGRSDCMVPAIGSKGYN